MGTGMYRNMKVAREMRSQVTIGLSMDGKDVSDFRGHCSDVLEIRTPT